VSFLDAASGDCFWLCDASTVSPNEVRGLVSKSEFLEVITAEAREEEDKAMLAFLIVARTEFVRPFLTRASISSEGGGQRGLGL
jgi:hypothetical protein